MARHGPRTDGAQTDGTDSTDLARRGFLSAVAGAGATAALGTEARAQAETYHFGGDVQAWHGEEPSAIEGQENPTLELEPGTEYEVVWENLDGQPHDFTIQDGSGNNIVATELVSEEGATASLTFTASPEMAQYICTVHPSTMVGDIQMAGVEQQAGGGPSLDVLLLVGAMLAAVLSPLAFALFLFLQRGGDEGQAGPRPGD